MNNTGDKTILNRKAGTTVIHDAKGVVDMSDDIQVQSGRQTLVASGDTVTINGNDTYDLRAVTAVAYYAIRFHIANVYRGTMFHIDFKQDKRNCRFLFQTDRRDEHIDEYAQSWLQLVARIEAIAIPRLADKMAAAVGAGETVSFGGVGDRVVLSPEGVKNGGLFGKLVPWSQVTRTDVTTATELGYGMNRVWGRKAPGAVEKVICGLSVSEWNSGVLPHVVSRLKG